MLVDVEFVDVLVEFVTDVVDTEVEFVTLVVVELVALVFVEVDDVVTAVLVEFVEVVEVVDDAHPPVCTTVTWTTGVRTFRLPWLTWMSLGVTSMVKVVDPSGFTVKWTGTMSLPFATTFSWVGGPVLQKASAPDTPRVIWTTSPAGTLVAPRRSPCPCSEVMFTLVPTDGGTV